MKKGAEQTAGVAPPACLQSPATARRLEDVLAGSEADVGPMGAVREQNCTSWFGGCSCSMVQSRLGCWPLGGPEWKFNWADGLDTQGESLARRL